MASALLALPFCLQSEMYISSNFLQSETERWREHMLKLTLVKHEQIQARFQSCIAGHKEAGHHDAGN